MYSLDQNNNSNSNGGFYQTLGPKSDFNNAYVIPTSSTSTGSNNSSMHSSQSMPEIMLDSSPKKSSNLPFQINNYIHTQTPPPPLIYPSSSSASNNNKPSSSSANAVQFALSTSASTPTAAASTSNQASTTSTATANRANGIDKPLDFPALFSMNHSSADETVSK